MKQNPDNLADPSLPLRSPYPALQAVLPRLASIGLSADDRPVFSDPEAVTEHLEQKDDQDAYCAVPVWAINHTDLMRSAVVNWTYTRWIH